MGRATNGSARFAGGKGSRQGFWRHWGVWGDRFPRSVLRSGLPEKPRPALRLVRLLRCRHGVEAALDGRTTTTRSGRLVAQALDRGLGLERTPTRTSTCRSEFRPSGVRSSSSSKRTAKIHLHLRTPVARVARGHTWILYRVSRTDAWQSPNRFSGFFSGAFPQGYLRRERPPSGRVGACYKCTLLVPYRAAK